MMDSVVIPTFRASFKIPGPPNHGLVGSPVNVDVPCRIGVGTTKATGVVAEVHDGFIVVEFIA